MLFRPTRLSATYSVALAGGAARLFTASSSRSIDERMAFMRYRGLPQGEVTVEEFWAWLGQFDADRDGRISREELQHALRGLHLWFAWWKAREGVRSADANRNGAIDGEEVGRLFAFAQRHLHVKITELGSY